MKMGSKRTDKRLRKQDNLSEAGVHRGKALLCIVGGGILTAVVVSGAFNVWGTRGIPLETQSIIKEAQKEQVEVSDHQGIDDRVLLYFKNLQEGYEQAIYPSFTDDLTLELEDYTEEYIDYMIDTKVKATTKQVGNYYKVYDKVLYFGQVEGSQVTELPKELSKGYSEYQRQLREQLLQELAGIGSIDSEELKSKKYKVGYLTIIQALKDAIKVNDIRNKKMYIDKSIIPELQEVQQEYLNAMSEEDAKELRKITQSIVTLEGED